MSLVLGYSRLKELIGSISHFLFSKVVLFVSNVWDNSPVKLSRFILRRFINNSLHLFLEE